MNKCSLVMDNNMDRLRHRFALVRNMNTTMLLTSLMNKYGSQISENTDLHMPDAVLFDMILLQAFEM